MTRSSSSLAPAAVIRAALAARGEAVFRVRGSSMRPLIPDGTLVRLRPVAPVALRAGDVIAVDTDGGILVHRLLGHTADGRLRTRGDAHDHDDAPAAPSDLLGRVVAVSPGAASDRLLPIALDRHAARLVGLALATIVLPALRRARRAARRFAAARRWL